MNDVLSGVRLAYPRLSGEGPPERALTCCLDCCFYGLTLTIVDPISPPPSR